MEGRDGREGYVQERREGRNGREEKWEVLFTVSRVFNHTLRLFTNVMYCVVCAVFGPATVAQI